MPQMNPMNWIMIFYLSIMIYWLMLSSIFFMFMKTIHKKFSYKTIHNYKMMFKW